jgi:phosphotransferase system HPr-like phosphotransfer protein
MESKVLIMNGLKKASCFSILEMLLLEAKFGSEVEIVAEGIDEALAMETVSGFF